MYASRKSNMTRSRLAATKDVCQLAASTILKRQSTDSSSKGLPRCGPFSLPVGALAERI